MHYILPKTDAGRHTSDGEFKLCASDNWITIVDGKPDSTDEDDTPPNFSIGL